MAGRPQINRQSKPASAFQQPGQPGAPPPSINRQSKVPPGAGGPPSINRQSKKPPPPGGSVGKPATIISPQDPAKLLEVCQLQGIEQAMIFLNLFWEDLSCPEPDAPSIRQTATLFDQLCHQDFQMKQQQQQKSKKGQPPPQQQPQLNVLTGQAMLHFLNEAGGGSGGIQGPDGGVGAGVSTLGATINEVKSYMIEVGIERLSPAFFGDSLPLFQYLLFRYRVDWHKVGVVKVDYFMGEMGVAKERLSGAHGAAAHALHSHHASKQQEGNAAAFQQAETALENGQDAVAAAVAFLKELAGKGVGRGLGKGTVWWLSEELKLAKQTVKEVGQERDALEKPKGGEANPDKDFNSFMMAKLTLDEDDDKPKKRAGGAPDDDDIDSLFDGMREKPEGASTSALRRLKEAEEMNQQSLESLQRQQAYFSNVGYKLEDMDRTLEAGDHYLRSCDGYIGAFATTVSGPTLRGKQQGRGDFGEPVVDEDGNIQRYGYTGEEYGPSLFTPPPPTQLPEAATGDQYAGVSSTAISAKASQEQREKFEQQERELNEMNAVLQNLNAMNAAVGQELKQQDVQINAVNAKQTDTQYAVERSTHKLNKLL